MGWRVSFGVGPLRYSAPLTSTRRRRTTRPVPYGPQYDRRFTRADRIVARVAIGVVGLVVVFVVAWTLLS